MLKNQGEQKEALYLMDACPRPSLSVTQTTRKNINYSDPAQTRRAGAWAARKRLIRVVLPAPKKPDTRKNGMEISGCIKKTGPHWAARLEKIPATCYSPMAYTTVPSPLGPFTFVFGMGTRVSSPPWSPEKLFSRIPPPESDRDTIYKIRQLHKATGPACVQETIPERPSRTAD